MNNNTNIDFTGQARRQAERRKENGLGTPPIQDAVVGRSDSLRPKNLASLRRRQAAALAVTAGLGLAGLEVASNLVSNEGSKVQTEIPEAPPATHTVTITPETPNVWDAVDDEALASGYPVDQHGHANTNIEDEVRQAVEMNKAKDPDFNSSALRVGDQIVIPDIPNRQNG